MVEHTTENRGVPGSSPGLAIHIVGSRIRRSGWADRRADSARVTPSTSCGCGAYARVVTDHFDRASWEMRWERAQGKRRPPSAHLIRTASELAPGRALDAGAGNGTEALWLAERGWHVDALDFAATALQDGAEAAARQGLAEHDRAARRLEVEAT